MFQVLLSLALVAGVPDCRESALSSPLEKLETLAKSLPRLPVPPKLPAAGNGIIRFQIDAKGRAHAIEIECESSAHTGKYLRDLVSVIRFYVPDNHERALHHQLGLTVEVADDTSVEVSDFP